MRLILLICLVLLSGCHTDEDVFSIVDRAVFQYLGGTVISDPDQLTMKEIHLDNGALVGREIVIEGSVIETGKYETFLIMSDETARLLIVLTELRGNGPDFKQNTPRLMRVLGTVENGKRGLPFVMARALKVLENPEGV